MLLLIHSSSLIKTTQEKGLFVLKPGVYSAVIVTEKYQWGQIVNPPKKQTPKKSLFSLHKKVYVLFADPLKSPH